MDILLIGASGFVGRNFILRAPSDWRILGLYHTDAGFPEFVSLLGRPNVTAARCDLTSAGQVASVAEKYGRNWESCLYLAGKVDIPWSVREPSQDLLLNTGPVLNTFDCFSCGRVVYFSSGAVYDGLQGEVNPAAPVSPTLPYAISKLACEQYIRFYCRRRKSVEKYLIVRFFGAYGPYEASHKIYTRLVRTFAMDRADSYAIYGSGQNLIDAMYIDDAVDAIRRMLTGGHWNDTIDLAGGHPLTIERLVREVGSALGVDSLRIEKQGVAHEDNQFWASASRMKTYFGFEPKITLAEGIVQLRDFLLARQSSAAG